MWRKWSTGDVRSWQIPWMTWISPTTPAAGSVCPTYVLPACTLRGMSTEEDTPPFACINTARTAPISIGSPSGVPVPCMCSWHTDWLVNEALRRAPRITFCCAGPLGAVRAEDRPSWFTAEPATHTILSLTPNALSKSNTPQASPRTYPSASASKVLHRPSMASMPACLNTAPVSGDNVRFTPHVKAAAHSSSKMLLHATWDPTRDEEQAVSVLTEGPCKPYM
mmetsp:Transcript_3413/g.8483  ORF Transcript_3413/g.8483 Transcript_3413/m.8483 type:complete len:223 (+) Transcript_3413:1358-2026(+)